MEVAYRRDPRAARSYLDRAREHAMSDLMAPFATAIEGQIRLEEGHPREARALLERAYEGAYALRHATPLMGAMLDLMRASLALACAGEGDLEAARRHYQAARPRLVALGVDDLIARCEQALGRPHGA